MHFEDVGRQSVGALQNCIKFIAIRRRVETTMTAKKINISQCKQLHGLKYANELKAMAVQLTLQRSVINVKIINDLSPGRQCN